VRAIATLSTRALDEVGGGKKNPHASRSRVHEINDHRSGVPCQREIRVGVLISLPREKTRRWNHAQESFRKRTKLRRFLYHRRWRHFSIIENEIVNAAYLACRYIVSRDMYSLCRLIDYFFRVEPIMVAAINVLLIIEVRDNDLTMEHRVPYLTIYPT